MTCLNSLSAEIFQHASNDWLQFYSQVTWIPNRRQQSKKATMHFVVGYWTIWKCRNVAIFSNQELNQLEITNIIGRLTNDYWDALQQEEYDDEQPEKQELIAWDFPSSQCVKLNVDGPSLGNRGRARFGGQLRDHLGLWLVSFYRSIN